MCARAPPCSACIVCDEDATMELKVKTVRYFKGIQMTMEELLRKPMEGYSGTSMRSPQHVPIMLPHGVPGSTRALIDEGGHFVLGESTLTPIVSPPASVTSPATGAGGASDAETKA
ncbi:hypothetical protein EON67_00060 [archaeon]|nr:MAG: hypothetical protein EON67_00060 [archaeon]